MVDVQVFACGDVVALKSGGPYMTVKEAADRQDGRGQGVTVVWYEHGSFQSEYFLGAMLEHASREIAVEQDDAGDQEQA